MGEVGAQAELPLTAKPAAQVGGQVALALFVGRYRYAAHILGALGHVIDQPARRRHATVQARKALEQFDLLLVLQRHVLLAGDGLAIDAVAAGGIEFEAAHVEVFVIADRGVAFADRRIALQHFAEFAYLAVLDQLLVENTD
ncbi:hypothetical protein D3C78_554170 [compost metagenome]